MIWGYPYFWKRPYDTPMWRSKKVLKFWTIAIQGVVILFLVVLKIPWKNTHGHFDGGGEDCGWMNFWWSWVKAWNEPKCFDEAFPNFGGERIYILTVYIYIYVFPKFGFKQPEISGIFRDCQMDTGSNQGPTSNVGCFCCSTMPEPRGSMGPTGMFYQHVPCKIN